jgi:hypothetical protein
MHFPLELFGRVVGVRGKFVDRAFVWGIRRRAHMGSEILADITRFRMCPLVFQLRTSITIPGCCGGRALVKDGPKPMLAAPTGWPFVEPLARWVDKPSGVGTIPGLLVLCHLNNRGSWTVDRGS